MSVLAVIFALGASPLAHQIYTQADAVVSKRVSTDRTGTRGAENIAAMPIMLVDDMGRPQQGDDTSSTIIRALATGATLPTDANMNVNGSITPQIFSVGPASGKMWRVHKINLTISDNSFDALDFGGIAGGLSNGILFQLRFATGPVIVNIIPYPILNNANISNLMAATIVTDFGSGIKTMSLIIDFREYCGGYTWLDGNGSLGAETLAFVVQDNLTAVDYVRAMLFGREYTK